ncbi:MAG: hypothetical protein LUG18_14560 [Candidatus Azobacteroides sp.]|nr:hypothetical protein [Candidatus Azobacteroides sp.]
MYYLFLPRMILFPCLKSSTVNPGLGKPHLASTLVGVPEVIPGFSTYLAINALQPRSGDILLAVLPQHTVFI